jgi:hypothetical protein
MRDCVNQVASLGSSFPLPGDTLAPLPATHSALGMPRLRCLCRCSLATTGSEGLHKCLVTCPLSPRAAIGGLAEGMGALYFYWNAPCLPGPLLQRHLPRALMRHDLLRGARPWWGWRARRGLAAAPLDTHWLREAVNGIPLKHVQLYEKEEDWEQHGFDNKPSSLWTGFGRQRWVARLDERLGSEAVGQALTVRWIPPCGMRPADSGHTELHQSHWDDAMWMHVTGEAGQHVADSCEAPRALHSRPTVPPA